MKSTSALTASLALALAVTGCAHKEDVKPEPTPSAQDTATPTPVPTVEPRAEAPAKAGSHYKVHKGDSLWKIAAKSSVLGDAFEWPLLYKQNRDSITDPDLIEINQMLDYSARMDAQEAATAIQKAKDTPPYSPHTAPRNPLPLKY